MRALLVLLVLAACGDNLGAPPPACSWEQWGRSAGHDGATCAHGQPLERALAHLDYDPFLAGEIADGRGDLLVHYQVPLIAGDDIYMLEKAGTYTPCTFGPDDEELCDLYRLETQVWTEKRYRWDGDDLVARWTFASDWKPVPGIRFEPVFQPAIAGDRIAIPGAGGSVFLVDRESGELVQRVMPFGGIDPDTYLVGGITAGGDGTLYYNTLAIDHDQPFFHDARSALVVVAPDGGVRTVDYASLVPGAPAATDTCEGQFDKTTPKPLPPPPNPDGTPVLPPRTPCGSQRAAVDAAPALGADGRIFVATRAHLSGRYAYVAALAPGDLSLVWATSLRGLLDDGCGVSVPADGVDGEDTDDCRVGATLGVDPQTNLPPAAIVDDNLSSSPVALPDGGVLYGAFTRYNAFRGHLLRFAADGGVAAMYDFGWDTTPAVRATGAGFEIIIKDNHYGEDADGIDLGPFELAHLDESLRPVWRFRSTEQNSCARDPNGTIVCSPDHPNGFEWCVNAPAIDADGVTYANSEDGNLYAITAGGNLRDRFFLDRALGAAYTPVALDERGRVYAMNGGTLTVVGAAR